MLSCCPLATTVEDIQRQFPTADRIMILPKGGPPNGRCLLTLPTVEEAVALTQTEGLEVNGSPVVARLAAVDREGEAAKERARSVMLQGLGPSTTASEVFARFPAAEAVTLVPRWPGGPSSGRCLVTFSTARDAAALAEAQTLEVDGHSVRAERVGDREEYELKRRLRSVIFVHFDTPPTPPEVLQAAFPDLETVLYTRPSRCFVAFPTRRAAKTVAQNRWVQLLGHWVKVRLADVTAKRRNKGLSRRRRERRVVMEDRKLRTLLLSGCPELSAPELQQMLPDCEEVALAAPGTWRVVFTSPEGAEKLAATPDFTLVGRPITTKLVVPWQWRHEYYSLDRPEPPQPEGAKESAKEVKKRLAWRRTVILSRCPWYATRKDFEQQFPKVENLQLLPHDGPFSGRCLLEFANRRHAAAVSRMDGLAVLGQPVVAKLGGLSRAAMTERERQHTVVLSGVPLSTTMEEMWQTFPSAAAIYMKGRWAHGPFNGQCHVVFFTKAEALALAADAGLEVGGQRVQPSLPEPPDVYEADRRNRSVFFTGCPDVLTEEEMLGWFPTAETVMLLRFNRGQFKGRCWLTFPTVAEADELLGLQRVKIKGKVVELSKCLAPGAADAATNQPQPDTTASAPNEATREAVPNA
eukprot:EG_transcript_3638